VLLIKEGRYLVRMGGKYRAGDARGDQAQPFRPRYALGPGGIDVDKIPILLGNNLECLVGVSASDLGFGSIHMMFY
jgi:hypothetical protein